jgi:adenosylhomocysteine nucleosidase
MLLIAAALPEELNIALDLCGSKKKIPAGGIGYWRAIHGDTHVFFLKTGVGPKRSAARLETFLEAVTVTRVFVLGYGGALAPELRLGDLVAVRHALDICSLSRTRISLEEVQPDGCWNLENWRDLISVGKKAGLNIFEGETLTSHFVIGDPSQRELLHRRFAAAVVDMETAALARVATARGVPLVCLRAVSDNAQDDFLAPLSYDPNSTLSGRARKIIASKHWIRCYRQWKEQAAFARQSLRRFLEELFSTDPIFARH